MKVYTYDQMTYFKPAEEKELLEGLPKRLEESYIYDQMAIYEPVRRSNNKLNKNIK